MSEMGFENVFYLENFDCAGDEVLVESSPPPSPGIVEDMAARCAAPAQGSGPGGGASPSAVRELIVIPELPNSIHLHNTMQQVSSSVVDVNGDSSGHSSPTADAQHTYITVAMQEPCSADDSCTLVKLEDYSDQESEGGNGVNYHVQYITEPQEIYSQTHQTHNIETLRSYPVYGVSNVTSGGGAGSAGGAGPEGPVADGGWPGTQTAPAEYTAYGLVVSSGGGVCESGEVEECEGEGETEGGSPPGTPGTAAPRMPPATVQWLLNHYETAEGVSLPRSSLYAHYLRHCSSHRLEPVNAASFGKLIRSVFVGLRTRRLGTRGNSKYHYYGIRAKPAANASGDADHEHHSLHADSNDDNNDHDSQESRSVSKDREVTVSPLCGSVAYRQYLGNVSAPEPPDLIITDLPDDIPQSALQALRAHHRAHGSEFLEGVSALDTTAVERARRGFWRRAPSDAQLCRRTLCRLAARTDVARWLRAADLQLHQRAVDMLLPDVLRPIPPHLTQAIRNFAKSLEGALSSGADAGGAPERGARAQSVAASALAAALRRYTSLNHLAQAARAVLTNNHQIHQMLSDLNRVDFRVVREQAAWACSCASAATAHRLEADFKATLGRGASLEQWASWLETCVRSALAPHERRPDYTSRARRLLLDWSFYSSLVIRELTLRSAASFGSFHLIRLLYDEYVSYLIERRVAAHRRVPPIAVMHRALDDDEDLLDENVRSYTEEDEHDWDWDDDDEEEDEQIDCDPNLDPLLDIAFLSLPPGFLIHSNPDRSHHSHYVVNPTSHWMTSISSV